MLNEVELVELLNSEANEITAIRPELDLARDSFEFDFIDSSGNHRIVKFSEIKRFNLTVSRSANADGYGFMINHINCIIGSEINSCEFELHGAELYIEFEKLLLI